MRLALRYIRLWLYPEEIGAWIQSVPASRFQHQSMHNTSGPLFHIILDVKSRNTDGHPLVI